LKVSRFSIGWFLLAAGLVKTFAHYWVKHNDFCCFKAATLYVALTLCYKLRSFYIDFCRLIISDVTAMNLRCCL